MAVEAIGFILLWLRGECTKFVLMDMSKMRFSPIWKITLMRQSCSILRQKHIQLKNLSNATLSSRNGHLLN